MKLTTGQIDTAVALLENNPTLILLEIIGTKVQAGCHPISQPTLQTYLDAEVMTYKTITNHTQSRNTEDSLAGRGE
jgi:hypothetical protein